jgi:integrase
MYFNYDGKRLVSTTGIKVAPIDWDDKKQRVKKLDVPIKREQEVNEYLDRLEQKVNDIYYGALAKGIYPDNNYILKEMKKDRKVEKLTMLEEWKKYLDIRKHNTPKPTHDALRHSYEHFERFAKGMRLNFDDIEPGLLAKYADYLQTEKNHVDNTIHKHFKRLRNFMAYAKDNGLHNNERYKKFNIPEREGRIIFLEWQEVKTLIDYQPETENERRVLDAFIFGCLTAMRYGDCHDLRRSEISPVNFEDIDEQFYSANFRQQKTRKLNIVPLLPEARAIIERHKNEPGDFALPRVRDSEINEAIKEIGRKAGITQQVAVDTFRGGEVETTYYEKWQLLSTKVGRKTFISCAASKGIPVHICAAVAGHSIKVCLKFYAGVADKERFVRVLKDMKLPAAKPKKTVAK